MWSLMCEGSCCIATSFCDNFVLPLSPWNILLKLNPLENEPNLIVNLLDVFDLVNIFAFFWDILTAPSCTCAEWNTLILTQFLRMSSSTVNVFLPEKEGLYGFVFILKIIGFTLLYSFSVTISEVKAQQGLKLVQQAYLCITVELCSFPKGSKVSGAFQKSKVIASISAISSRRYIL